MEQILSKNFAQINYDKIKNIIYISWIGYPSFENAQTGLNTLLDTIKDKKCKKVLVDQRQLKGTFTQYIGWISDVWFPEAVKSGFEFCAYVYSPDVFSRFALQKLIEKSNNHSTCNFNDFAEAENWLIAS